MNSEENNLKPERNYRMKSLILFFALLLITSSVFAVTPSPTAVDTIYLTVSGGSTKIVGYSVLYVLSLTTTADTIVLPALARNFYALGRGAASDTILISFSQSGTPGFSEWLLGTASVQRDFGKAYLKKLFVKAKSGSSSVWIRVY
jgi:hypothetical protein